MAVVELRKCLIILMILYTCALILGIAASGAMIQHVFPQSECLLFSYPQGDKLFYGNYASCNIVAYVFLFVICGAIYLWARCWMELRRMQGHHPQGPYVPERVPKHILWVHLLVTLVTLILTIITTAGYAMGCNQLFQNVFGSLQRKLNANPYDTRGEEIQTRHEDDYKFHRYTNRYGNAFGSEVYTIGITCRSIFTDPDIHQRLHDTHYEQLATYYGYWYGQDLYSYDSQYQATLTNSLIETTMVSSWLCFVFLLGGLILILLQKFLISKKQAEQDRVSMHSTVMGMGSMYQGQEGSMVGSQFRKDGSIMGSSFQRGGSRGSDRSMRSSRRAIDDLALSEILGNKPVKPTSTSYGRKDIDDMVINNYISSNSQPRPSQYSSRETGYISDGSAYNPGAGPSYNQGYNQGYNQAVASGYNPAVGSGYNPSGTTIHYPAPQAYPGVPVRKTAEATYLSRDEVETEIF